MHFLGFHDRDRAFFCPVPRDGAGVVKDLLGALFALGGVRKHYLRGTLLRGKRAGRHSPVHRRAGWRLVLRLMILRRVVEPEHRIVAVDGGAGKASSRNDRKFVYFWWHVRSLP